MNKIIRPKQRKDEIIQDPVYYNKAEEKYIIKCVSKRTCHVESITLFLVLDTTRDAQKHANEVLAKAIYD